ncbi:hypothetical protein AAGW05_10635 [Arthrobacter sp. LAPM80]
MTVPTVQHLSRVRTDPTAPNLHIGTDAVVEVTGLRNPCAQIENVFKGLLKELVGYNDAGEIIRRAGIMGTVHRGGTMHAGDCIEVLLPVEPHVALERVWAWRPSPSSLLHTMMRNCWPFAWPPQPGRRTGSSFSTMPARTAPHRYAPQPGVCRNRRASPSVAGASARGLDAAGADILAGVDADSRSCPDWLERIEADLASGEFGLVTGPGNFYGGTPLVRWPGRVLCLGGYFQVAGFLLGHTPVFGSNNAMTADVWARVGGSMTRDNPEIHDDLETS